MKKLALICMVLLLVGISFGVCPSADLTGDCKVNLADFAIMASEWLTEGIFWGGRKWGGIQRYCREIG